MYQSMPLPKWDIALDRLTPAQKNEIGSRLRVARYAPREPLFLQGEPSDSLVVVRSGRVRLYAGTESGAEFTLGVMDSGRILGLAAAMLGKPRILSAEAIDTVEAGIFRLHDLQLCMQSIPQFSQNVMTLLATLAAETLAGIVPVALDSAVVRLATILLSLGTPDAGDPSASRLQVTGLTQEDLAKMVGATRTWVTLALGTMERNRLIEKKKGRITILERDRFIAFIEAQRNNLPFTAA